MGLYSKIPGFCGAPWAVGAPRIVTTFHPTSNGPACEDLSLLWPCFLCISAVLAFLGSPKEFSVAHI